MKVYVYYWKQVWKYFQTINNFTQEFNIFKYKTFAEWELKNSEISWTLNNKCFSVQLEISDFWDWIMFLNVVYKIPLSFNLTKAIFCGGRGLFCLYYGNTPRTKRLCCLEFDKKFVMGWWWVVVVVECKPILVFSFDFGQAEQYILLLMTITNYILT